MPHGEESSVAAPATTARSSLERHPATMPAGWSSGTSAGASTSKPRTSIWQRLNYAPGFPASRSSRHSTPLSWKRSRRSACPSSRGSTGPTGGPERRVYRRTGRRRPVERRVRLPGSCSRPPQSAHSGRGARRACRVRGNARDRHRLAHREARTARARRRRRPGGGRVPVAGDPGAKRDRPRGQPRRPWSSDGCPIARGRPELARASGACVTFAHGEARGVTARTCSRRPARLAAAAAATTTGTRTCAAGL